MAKKKSGTRVQVWSKKCMGTAVMKEDENTAENGQHR